MEEPLILLNDHSAKGFRLLVARPISSRPAKPSFDESGDRLVARSIQVNAIICEGFPVLCLLQAVKQRDKPRVLFSGERRQHLGVAGQLCVVAGGIRQRSWPRQMWNGT